jgi:hypothetical protein
MFEHLPATAIRNMGFVNAEGYRVSSEWCMPILSAQRSGDLPEHLYISPAPWLPS